MLKSVELISISLSQRVRCRSILTNLAALATMMLVFTLSSTVANAACSVTYTFSNGTTADATQVNQNFADLAACSGSGGGPWTVTGSNLVANSTAYNVGIGTATPVTKLTAYGTSNQPSATAEVGILTLWGSSTAQLAIGSTPLAPYGFWFQTKFHANTGDTYPISLNPVGGSVIAGGMEPVANYKLVTYGGTFSSIWPSNPSYGISIGGSSQDWGVVGMNVYFGSGATRRYITNDVAGWLEWKSDGGIAYVNAPAGSAGSLVSGTNRFHIAGTGNVGIGSSTPSEKLYVAGNIYASGNITCGGTCPGGSGQWNLTGTNLVPNSTTYKVGIGLVTSPSTTLDVGGTLNASGAVTLESTLNVIGAVTCGSGCAAGPWSVSGSNIVPSSTSYNLGVGTTSPTEKLYVTGNIYATGSISCGGTCGGSSPLSLSGSSIIPASTSYNMGIGTTSPGSTAALDIVSNSNWSGGWNGNLRLQSTSYPTLRLYATGVNKSAFIGNNADGGLWFGVNGSGDSYGSYAMILTSGGYLGIGSTPSYQLHVAGTAYATGAAGALSDIRHKKNIVEIRDAVLPRVMKLRPVSYEWKKPTDDGMKGQQIGFIAQDVEKVFPASVLTQRDRWKTKGLKYNELIPILTKALQEQQQEIRVLRGENESKAVKLVRLQGQVGALERVVRSQSADLEQLRTDMVLLVRNASANPSRNVAAVVGETR